jgi:hypothetical protein
VVRRDDHAIRVSTKDVGEELADVRIVFYREDRWPPHRSGEGVSDDVAGGGAMSVWMIWPQARQVWIGVDWQSVVASWREQGCWRRQVEHQARGALWSSATNDVLGL